MNFTEAFGIWVAIFTLAFMLLPIELCYDWYKRGTSDGFSSVTFVLVTTSVSFWLRYASILQDPIQIAINTIALGMFAVYLLVYYVHQTNKLICVVVLELSVSYYISTFTEGNEAKEAMGSISSTFQIITLAGLLYEIYRVLFLLKTTEYLPFNMTAGGSVLNLQWYILGLLLTDLHIQRANLAGLAINAVIFILYFPYPPQTWTLPWQASKNKTQ